MHVGMSHPSWWLSLWQFLHTAAAPYTLPVDQIGVAWAAGCRHTQLPFFCSGLRRACHYISWLCTFAVLAQQYSYDIFCCFQWHYFRSLWKWKCAWSTKQKTLTGTLGFTVGCCYGMPQLCSVCPHLRSSSISSPAVMQQSVGQPYSFAGCLNIPCSLNIATVSIPATVEGCRQASRASLCLVLDSLVGDA